MVQKPSPTQWSPTQSELLWGFKYFNLIKPKRSDSSCRLTCNCNLFVCLLHLSRHIQNLMFALMCITQKKRWQQEPGKSTWETTWVMNERCIASQIRFVFQSSSSHIPYWLKPNNLMRCSPPPFASSSSSFLSLSPKRNDLPVLLSLLKKSWQQITLPDLKVEPLILMISINHDKDIKKKRIGWVIHPTHD